VKRIALVLAVVAMSGVARAADIDFDKQIRPILADSCYKCHDAKKQKGKLRLDTKELFLKGGKDGKVLDPGNPAKSDLYRRITLSKDDDDVMPPEGDLLPKDKQNLIKEWIAQGANFGSWTSDAGKGGAKTEVGEAAPKEAALPKVAAADTGAIEKIRQTGALAMPLAQDTNLVEVDLNLVGDKVENTQLALLTPLDQQLAVLNLARTKVTDDGLKSVEGLANLRKLHLENTKVGDEGLTHLKGLTNLEYLNLYNTQVTDAGLKNLEGLKNLKSLYLWQTKVTPEGVDSLKKALPKCEINTGWDEKADKAKADEKKADDKKDEKKPDEKPKKVVQ
jgi:cytochrome c/Leucine Rich Repeat (LRR) protein